MKQMLHHRSLCSLCMVVLILLWVMPLDAQNPQEKADKMMLNHLDMGVGLGLEGVGLDVALPIGHYVQLRAGMSYMPRFEATVSFQATAGTGLTADQFDKMADLMSQMMGVRIEDRVDMIARPTFWNGKVLIDVFPFKKKNWFFSAGVYIGPKRVVQAYNATEATSSLMGLNMYNYFYERVLNEEEVFSYNGVGIELPPAICDKFLSYGRMSVPMGTFSHDIRDAEGCLLHAEGEEYRMLPDVNGMVRLDAISNLARPYLGFGCRVPISKDQRSFFSFNAGVFYWGKLKMITHDGVDLIGDLREMPGQMEKYVRLASSLQVYPVLNISLSRRLF